MSEPVSLETRVNRNTNGIEALYGLIQGFEGRTRSNFARNVQPFVALAQELRTSGHDAVLAAPARFATFAGEHGVPFRRSRRRAVAPPDGGAAPVLNAVSRHVLPPPAD